MRAALYARYSTAAQNPASIADQLAVCRRYAVRIGARVVAEYSDAAVSGLAMRGRPGLEALVATARGGAIDVVICESLDRLSRTGSHIWGLYEGFVAAGVDIHTVSDGPVNEAVLGLKGALNAMLLREIGAKTRRGLEGVARDGRRIGAPAYGYRLHREFAPDGRVLAGLTAISEPEARVVREIFRRYADGETPRAIAVELNGRGVPGPGGRPWKPTTINGCAAKGRGVLHNERYRGIQVFGRLSWPKDATTGRRQGRPNRDEEVMRRPAPHLRIVSDALWNAAHARHAKVGRPLSPPAPRRVRPRRLFAGLVRCGHCDGPMSLTGAGQRYRCSTRINWGADACENVRTTPADQVEAEIAALLRDALLHESVVQAAVGTVPGAPRAAEAAYRAHVEDLESTFAALSATPHAAPARRALSRLFGAIRLTAGPSRGDFGLEIDPPGRAGG